MLQSIRDHAQGWIAWTIVGLIIITFALFGIDQYAQGDKTVVVAEVNGEEVTANQFLNLYSRQQSRLKNQFGDLYDQVVKDADLRDQVLDALIESEVVRQWAKSHDMIISDQQLAMTIESAAVFQKDGQFDEALYQDILMRNGLNVALFEYEQRQYLIENQNRQLTAASAFVMDDQVTQLAALQFQKRDVNYLRVDQRPFIEKADISDDDIKGYYEQHKQEFVTPEMVQLSYVLLSQQALADQLTVDDATVEQFYEANKDQFTDPEKRQASHILVKIDEQTDDAAALAEIEEIQGKLAEGADFAELAREYSDDPGSAALGGDLGLFQQGMMVPEFDEAVFTMSVGETSQPVKTDFGYHLIQLTEIQPKKVLSFEEVKPDVAEMVLDQQAEKQYFELLEQLNTVAYEQPDSLVPAAEVVGLEIQTTDKIPESGGVDTVTSNPKVLAAAFSEDVKKSGLNSSVIELSPTESIVIRVDKVAPETQLSLADVKAEIVTRLKREAAINVSAVLADELLQTLNKGGVDMQSLAKEGVEFTPVGWLERENQRVLPQLTQAIFKAPKPQTDQPTYSIYQLPTGDSVIIELIEVEAGKLSDKNEEFAQLKDVLLEIYATSEIEGRIETMISKAKIEKKSNYKTLRLSGL
ncbi:MAG: SurA N-terminal domain-containing protein [Hydrogenovibrio sp.]